MANARQLIDNNQATTAALLLRGIITLAASQGRLTLDDPVAIEGFELANLAQSGQPVTISAVSGSLAVIAYKTARQHIETELRKAT